MNEKYLRDQFRDLEILKIKIRKSRQSDCLHRKGEASDYPPYNDRLAFHLLKLPTGEIVGVCPYCQKLISSIDPSDAKFFDGIDSRDKERMPESGQFLPDNDDKLFKQLARYTPEEKDRVLKETIAKLKNAKQPEPAKEHTSYSQQVLREKEMWEMPMEDLKVLAQKFMDDTYPNRRKRKK